MAGAPKPKRPRQSSALITEKRQTLANAILEGASLSEASRIADMHPATANTALRSDDVKQYLAKARQEIEEISTLRRCDVLNLLVEAIDMARSQGDPANMIGGAREIAKMMGYYAPETRRIELTGDSLALQRHIQDMTDADLIDLASRRARVIEGEVVT
jgi:phage terminase small subunit